MKLKECMWTLPLSAYQMLARHISDGCPCRESGISYQRGLSLRIANRSFNILWSIFDKFVISALLG